MSLNQPITGCSLPLGNSSDLGSLFFNQGQFSKRADSCEIPIGSTSTSWPSVLKIFFWVVHNRLHYNLEKYRNHILGSIGLSHDLLEHLTSQIKSNAYFVTTPFLHCSDLFGQQFHRSYSRGGPSQHESFLRQLQGSPRKGKGWGNSYPPTGEGNHRGLWVSSIVGSLWVRGLERAAVRVFQSCGLIYI